MSRLDQIADLEKRFLLPTYNRYPVGFERGKGVFLYDFEGRKYLDFVAGLGVNALGHAHPRIVKTIREQAARVIHLSNLYYNEYQGQLAERLCQLSGLDRVFFSNSGTEAMEMMVVRRQTFDDLAKKFLVFCDEPAFRSALRAMAERIERSAAQEL